MTLAVWIMKQYWRLGTIRALVSLALGMFVLGRLYYPYVPVLGNLGLLGALILGSTLTLFFMGLGWLYDVKGKMWSPKLQAATERHPYYYVSDFRGYAIDYPVYYSLFQALRGILSSEGLNDESIDESISYFDQYFSRKPERSDLIESEQAAEYFMQNQPFIEDQTSKKKRIPITARVKLGYEVTMLRLIWIQSLTAMVMDALVFGALFVTLAFPDEAIGNVVPLNYLILGLLFLSLPLFLLVAVLGWYYDKKLKVWSADSIVKVERNPYNYIPLPKMHIYVMPIFYTLFLSLKDIFENQELDSTKLGEIINYIEQFNQLSVKRDKDMANARKLRSSLGDLFQKEIVDG